jgi:T-complex protein 1 subunit eta
MNAGAPVLVLKEETDARFGKNQVISNIEACEKVADFLKSTLGPNGMDKLFFNGTDLMISNDGATIMKSLEITHPAARIMANISESQDKDIGDGTTSVVLLAAAIMGKMKELVRENLPVHKIAEFLEKALFFVQKKAKEQLVDFSDDSLLALAGTSLNSKILCTYREHFSQMVIRALETSEIENIGIKKVPGAGLEKSFLVEGVAFEKCFTYAGYEQQPKKLKNPKIALLRVELEWKSEAENAEVRISGTEEYQKVVNAEWSIIKDKLDRIIESGASVVLSLLPVGDYATQYFARKGVFSVGRVPDAEMKRVTSAFGGRVVSSVGLVDDAVLARCDEFEELEVGRTRMNFFRGKARASTIVLRGPGMEILEEAHRSLWDSLMVVRRAMGCTEIVSGGGAFEMEISRGLRVYSSKFSCGGRFVLRAVSEAFEIIPFQLAKNSGFDPVAVVQGLRKAHHEGKKFFGVSLNGGWCDCSRALVVEPLEGKVNMAKAAINAAIAIVSIDSTIVSGAAGNK